MKRTLACIAGLGLAVIAAHGAAGDQKRLLPQAPEKYLRMVNPQAESPRAFADGGKIYRAKCARCHELSTSGERRGPDLNVREVKQAAPGTLYWVLEKGNDDMPSFARFPEKYRWAVVTYLQRR